MGSDHLRPVGGGRLILNVPGPAPRPFAVMREALARHIGAEAAGFVNDIFSLHDTAEIQNLVRGAGFHDVCSVRHQAATSPGADRTLSSQRREAGGALAGKGNAARRCRAVDGGREAI